MGRIKARRERELERKKANKVAPPDSALKKNKRAKIVSTKGSVLKPHSHGHEPVAVETPARPSRTEQEAPVLVTPLPVALQGGIRKGDDDSTVSESFINLEASAPTESNETILGALNDNSVQLSLSSDDESSATMSTKRSSSKMTLKQAKERIELLQMEIANYKSSLKTANEEAKSQEGRINQLISENDSLRYAVEEIEGGDSLKNALKQQAKDLAKLESENESMRENTLELCQQKESSDKRAAELERQIVDLKAKITQQLSLNKGNDHQKSDENLQKKITALEQQVTALKSQNKTLANDMKNSSKDAATELDKAQKELAVLQRELSAKSREVKKLEQMLQEAPDEESYQKVTENYQKVTEKYKKYKKWCSELQVKLQNGGNGDEALALEMEKVVKEKKDLELANKQLQKAVDNANNILKADGKFSKHEVREIVDKKIKSYIKDNLYPKTKFAIGSDAQRDFCKIVYDGIKDDKELGLGDPNNRHYKSVDEFCRIYDASCRGALQARRQYTQTQCFNAVLGTLLPL